MNKPNLKIGNIPEAGELIPQKYSSMTALLALSGTVMHYAALISDGSPNAITGATFGALSAGWLYTRHITRELRDGWLLEKPFTAKQEKAASNAHWELTDHFKKIGIDSVVSEKKTHQYTIYTIKNREPKKVAEQLAAVSMILGIDQDELKFIQNYQKGTSAILAPLPVDEWESVEYTKQHLKQGRLIGFIGYDIKGAAVTYDRRLEPHVLISGDTNSGKSEALRVDIQSMRDSGLSVEFIMIDEKMDFEGEKESFDFYTQSQLEGVEKLESLIERATARKAKYSQARCKNFFEYQEKEPQEKAIFVYIDETAKFLMEDPTEQLEQGETPLHKRAYKALYTISFLLRAAGIFLTLGIQHPKATIIDTALRNNLGATIALSQRDAAASRVAIDQNGAETLPKFGAFMFKSSSNRAPIIGRGAYIQGE